MGKLRFVLLSISILVSLLLDGCELAWPKAVESASANVGCIQSFDEWAYHPTDVDKTNRPQVILPQPPWQIDAIVPITSVEGYFVSIVGVEASRSKGGNQEIWLRLDLLPTEGRQSSKNAFLIYQPKSQKWKFVPADIGATSLFVQDLFVTDDGSVWGQTVWDTTHGLPTMDKVPALSRFNESTQRFEFPKGVLEIPSNQSDRPYFPWSEILLDDRNVFWLFAKDDGLYKYDPVTQRTEKQTDLPGFAVTQAALAPDGRIYFEIYSEKIYSDENFFRLSDGMMFQFNPETGEILPLDIPDDPWPVFWGMLVDRNGRLWLGANGYRDLDGEWRLVHSNTQEYFNHAGDIYWASPELLLESSNGILWFHKFLDSDTRAEGTAWYDPRTGNGCMFTNLAAEIIEDSQKQLWLVVDGILYRYTQ